MTHYGSHTESRMRENCTYGSMRGRAFPTGRPALLYTLFVNMEFLAEIAKIVPQGDTTFSPCEKIYFAPPEEKRFSKSF